MGEDGLWETTESGSLLCSFLSCSCCSRAKPAAMSLGTKSVSWPQQIRWNSISSNLKFHQPHTDTAILTKSPHREESVEKFGDIGKHRSVAFILWQTTAHDPQSALPHINSQGAGGGEELGLLCALQVSNPQRLHRGRLRLRVSKRVKHNQHTHSREEQDDPAVPTKTKILLVKLFD